MPDKTRDPVCPVKGGYLPSYAYPGDAGADLRATASVLIPARGRCLVPTGLQLAIPAGHVGLVWPRSGLAVKHGLDTGAGVIDSQYRGEICILVFNHSDVDYQVNPGDRMAQLLIQKVERVRFIQAPELEDTTRGENGFGSSSITGGGAEKSHGTPSALT
jgi:dUTP pyrophosphatase